MKDALVEAALAKVNETIGKIFELKVSDYPGEEELTGDQWISGKQTYTDAVSEAVAKAIKTVDALRAALKVLEPEEYELAM